MADHRRSGRSNGNDALSNFAIMPQGSVLNVSFYHTEGSGAHVQCQIGRVKVNLLTK